MHHIVLRRGAVGANSLMMPFDFWTLFRRRVGGAVLLSPSSYLRTSRIDLLHAEMPASSVMPNRGHVASFLFACLFVGALF